MTQTLALFSFVKLLFCTLSPAHGSFPTTPSPPTPSQLPHPRIFVNFRDMCQAMCVESSYNRVLTLAAALARMDESVRPEGIIFEDPTGYMMPLQVRHRAPFVYPSLYPTPLPTPRIPCTDHHPVRTPPQHHPRCISRTRPHARRYNQACGVLMTSHARVDAVLLHRWDSRAPRCGGPWTRMAGHRATSSSTCTTAVACTWAAGAHTHTYTHAHTHASHPARSSSIPSLFLRGSRVPPPPTHTHRSEACVMESLANGATGIWCGVSRVGASVGHCSSVVTLYNLHRLGNPHVAEMYNLPAIRDAAIEVHGELLMVPLRVCASQCVCSLL